MTALADRVAWCAVCRQPTRCDEDGCLVCEELDEKKAEFHREHVRRNRRKRRAAGECINGQGHPKPRNGECRCDWCKDVHRRGIADVLASPKFERPS